MIYNKMLGGWYGRICGCLLGKPVEGMRSYDLKTVCEMSENYPLSRYIDKEDLPQELIGKIGFPVWDTAYPRNIGRMTADDDTNYMIMAFEVLKRFGREFTSENVGRVWLETQTKNAYCTAERVAYINLIKGYTPPYSGMYKNAYREWIGAQIRGDVYGYVNPCQPKTASEMAFRDARVSHVKNGIYGEMWIAATIAAAYGSDSVLNVIRRGLAEIPSKSRLFAAVSKIADDYEKGVSSEDCFKSITSRWDETKEYDWCHTIPNAEIVAASLLYGEGDYGKSVCMAVSQGFDTDCNGATVGSVLGVLLGYDRLPKEWTERIHDTLETTLFGYGTVSVKDMVKQSMSFLPQNQ